MLYKPPIILLIISTFRTLGSVKYGKQYGTPDRYASYYKDDYIPSHGKPGRNKTKLKQRSYIALTCKYVWKLFFLAFTWW